MDTFVCLFFSDGNGLPYKSHLGLQQEDVYFCLKMQSSLLLEPIESIFILFIFICQQLQNTSRNNLIFKQQKTFLSLLSVDFTSSCITFTYTYTADL